MFDNCHYELDGILYSRSSKRLGTKTIITVNTKTEKVKYIKNNDQISNKHNRASELI